MSVCIGGHLQLRLCRATALFADEGLVDKTYGPILTDDGSPTERNFGLLMGGDAQLLATSIVGIVVMIGWVLGHMVRLWGTFLREHSLSPSDCVAQT